MGKKPDRPLNEPPAIFKLLFFGPLLAAGLRDLIAALVRAAGLGDL